MSIIRVNKSKNYTIMSNSHFKEKKMSLKAKGLLSLMLSLPDEWDYSINGLIQLNRDNESSVKSALNELKKFNYLVITKKMPNETNTGRIEYVYDIYEKPKQEGEKQDLENLPLEILPLEKQPLENPGQYNNNNKNINNKKIKYNIYGTYKRIKLTEEEYNKLVKDFGKDFIDRQITLLDEYVETNNNKNKYSNFNLVLRKSIRENWFNSKKEETPDWFKQENKNDLTQDEKDEFNNILNNFK